MAQTSVTFDQIAQWLIDNPTKKVKGKVVQTGVPDAVKALGYAGGPLKIREGNLTWNRANLRVSAAGQSRKADSYRKAAQRATTPDKEIRKLANIKISYINKRGKVADHILTNSALRNGEEYVRMLRGEEGVQEMRRRYANVSGYGHSKENIQALTPTENQAKELQERKLRGRTSDSNSYLKHLENKPPIDSPDYPKWEAKRAKFAEAIDTNFIPTRGGLKFAGRLSRFAAPAVAGGLALSVLNQQSVRAETEGDDSMLANTRRTLADAGVAGDSLAAAGMGLSATGVGAVVGVPMAAVGEAVSMGAGLAELATDAFVTNDAKAKEAVKRGGRFQANIGGLKFKMPEFGLSERLGLN